MQQEKEAQLLLRKSLSYRFCSQT